MTVSAVIVGQRELANAWHDFVQGRPFNRGIIPPHVLKGWEKSIELGVDPEHPMAPPVLSGDELETLDNYQTLLTAAEPMLEMLRVSIHNTGYIATLALASGHLIAVVGDDNLMDEARSAFNIPGALRNIEAVGSSALWICLTEKMPVQISGYEHFCKSLHEWKCAAAPILDEGDEPIGALAISSHISRKDIHTLTLAKSCAGGIGIRLRESKLLRTQRRLNAALQAALDSLDEQVITVTEEGTISHANCRASAFEPGEHALLAGKPVSELFSASSAGRVARIMKRSGITTVELEIRISGRLENRLCRFVPIRLEDGRFGGTILSITGKKQLMAIARHVSGNYAKYSFEDIKGGAPELMKQLELAKRAAPTQSRILLTGESGTGKELFAQAIHNGSSVRNGPFVALSCAAIPRDLIESELFGYVGGAFTGARKNGMIGKVELASGGTLFLDEVNSLPFEMQAKLLRALQQREIVRIGDTKPTPADARIISAANRDLKQAIAEGVFREDLYYRLNVVEIVIPPLRERRGDLELLADLILQRQNLETGLPCPRLSRDTVLAMQNYSWPGNIRELDNVCERALLVSGGGVIEREHLPPHIRDVLRADNASQGRLTASKACPQPLGGEDFDESLPGGSRGECSGANERVSAPAGMAALQDDKTIEHIYAESIRAALRRNRGNLSRTATQLGIARSTLYRKMAQLGIREEK